MKMSRQQRNQTDSVWITYFITHSRHNNCSVLWKDPYTYTPETNSATKQTLFLDIIPNKALSLLVSPCPLSSFNLLWKHIDRHREKQFPPRIYTSNTGEYHGCKKYSNSHQKDCGLLPCPYTVKVLADFSIIWTLPQCLSILTVLFCLCRNADLI